MLGAYFLSQVVGKIRNSFLGSLPLSSRLQHTLHSAHLPPIFNDTTPIPKDFLECFEHTLETAFGAFLLREACDRKIRFAAVFEHGKEFDGEGDRADV